MTTRQLNLLKPGVLLQSEDKIYEFLKVSFYRRSKPDEFLLQEITDKQLFYFNKIDMLKLTEITTNSSSYKAYKVLYATAN
jgi:hypothetical protein